MTPTKKCIECDEPIKGRADKKFCSDLCRNSYNNRQNSDTTNHVRNVNNILRRNRRIISELIPDGEEKAKAHRSKLADKGYNFSFYTNTYTTQKGTVYYFCYEYGYLPIGNDFFFLVLRKQYDDKSDTISN